MEFFAMKAAITEQQAKLGEITKSQQAERFANLGAEGQERFLRSLIEKDKFSEQVANRIFSFFKSGDAGSVEDALELMRTEDEESNKSYTTRKKKR